MDEVTAVKMNFRKEQWKQLILMSELNLKYLNTTPCSYTMLLTLCSYSVVIVVNAQN